MWPYEYKVKTLRISGQKGYCRLCHGDRKPRPTFETKLYQNWEYELWKNFWKNFRFSWSEITFRISAVFSKSSNYAAIVGRISWTCTPEQRPNISLENDYSLFVNGMFYCLKVWRKRADNSSFSGAHSHVFERSTKEKMIRGLSHVWLGLENKWVITGLYVLWESLCANFHWRYYSSLVAMVLFCRGCEQVLIHFFF